MATCVSSDTYTVVLLLAVFFSTLGGWFVAALQARSVFNKMLKDGYIRSGN